MNRDVPVSSCKQIRRVALASAELDTMVNRRRFLLSLTLLAISPSLAVKPALAAPGPLQVCQERLARNAFQDETQALLAAGKFDRLEQIAAHLRAAQSLYPDGTPKLSDFYHCFQRSTKSAPDYEKLLPLETNWIGQYPQSCTPLVLRANTLVNYAWLARGNGYANTITEEGGRLFEQRMALAKKDLLAAQGLAGKDPFPFVEMLIVAKTEVWDRRQTDALFAQCLQRFPLCQPAFTQMATYLLPRWAGHSGDLEAFTSEWAGKTRATGGNSIYAEIYEAIGNYRNVDHEVRLDWPQIKQGFEDLLKHHPSSITRNRYMYAAVMFRDYAAARQAAGEMGDEWDPPTWKNKQDVFEKIRASVLSGK